MRFGGPVFVTEHDPEAFALAHVQKGYKAAYYPKHLKPGQSGEINAYKEALRKEDILIAEVGAWRNPLALEPEAAKFGKEYFIEKLALADELGARCCVGIVGTWAEENWYAPSEKNFKEDFFDYAVEVHRSIIDAVKPKHTKMTYELMPFGFLDSAEEYLRFLKALDRKEAGVHLDLTNMITCPRQLFGHREFLTGQMDLLGDAILSIHIKDMRLLPDPLSVMLEEVPMGKGVMDYTYLARYMNRLPRDTTVMLEHLPDEETYDAAAAAFRKQALAAGIQL